MKDILVLLVLLNAQTLKVCSQPYQADSDGNCLTSTDYKPEGSNLCCKKCPPGQSLAQACSTTTDTVCKPCSTGFYSDSWNYHPNCFACLPCKPTKGLQVAQSCSSTVRSTCVCQPGRYCSVGFDDPFCSACTKYQRCKHGAGVSVPGTRDKNVACKPCPSGTFSNTVSSTDPCLPHTNCHGRVVVRNGNATSDTVCQPEAIIAPSLPQTTTRGPRTELVFTTTSTAKSTVLVTSDSVTLRGPTDTTLSISPSFSEAVFNSSAKTPQQSAVPDSTLAAVIGGAVGLLLFFIVIILLFLCIRKEDAARSSYKVDANGNCESGDKINPNYLGETQLNYIKVQSPEQQRLLLTGEASSDHSQSSTNTGTLTQTDGSSSQESIGPLQSTIPLYSPHSALSEPMTLISNTEAAPLRPSYTTQSSSQPTSPQVISPVTTSPHVNVNITFHIENRSCGTPSVTPTDSIKVDSELPFGEEEESFSIPHQEAGKQSVMSVQESESRSA